MPTFHASLALPNLTPRETWEYKGSPEELAEDLRWQDGAIMPDSMRSDLHADATLAWYGDLHIDHIGAVFQMEAVRRDTAALRLAETPDSTMAARSHLAVLDHHGSVLIADLHERRMDSIERDCSPSELIGAYSADWTQDARVRELRTWPGGEHTARVVAEYDTAIATWQYGPDSESLTNSNKITTVEENFSTNMSQARIREWSDQTSQPGAASTLSHQITSTPLTAADLRARTHTLPNSVDRGIRREPAPPPTPHTDTAAVQRQRAQNRIDHAPSAAPEHRRPSM